MSHEHASSPGNRHPANDLTSLEDAEAKLVQAARALAERWPPYAIELVSWPPEVRAIRSATGQWARTARRDGHPPEWLLIRARQLLKQPPLTEHYLPREKGGWDRLDAFVARCAIESYFAEEAVERF